MALFHGIIDIANSGYEANALFTPSFRSSLLSISSLETASFTSTFGNGRCLIPSPSSNITTSGHLAQANNLYIIEMAATAAPASTTTTHTLQVTRKRKRHGELPTVKRQLSPPAIKMWHHRLAHANPTVLRTLLGIQISTRTTGTAFSNGHDICDICIQAKHKDRPLRIAVKRTTQPFELIHSDVCGPFKHSALGTYRYYIIFVCDYTRWAEIFLLPGTKSEWCSSAFITLRSQ